MRDNKHASPRLGKPALLSIAIALSIATVVALVPTLYGCKQAGSATPTLTAGKRPTQRSTVGVGAFAQGKGSPSLRVIPAASLDGGVGVDEGPLTVSDANPYASSGYDSGSSPNVSYGTVLDSEVSAPAQEDSTWTQTLSQTIEPAEGVFYTVSVTYGDDAGISPDATLVVEELESNDERRNALHALLNVREDECVFQDVFLKIALKVGEEEVQPNASVRVAVETNRIAPRQSDAVEASVIGGSGEGRLTVINRTGAVDGVNSDGGGETADPSATALRFQASGLGEVGFAVVATPKHQTDINGEVVTVLGPRTKGIECVENEINEQISDDQTIVRALAVVSEPAHAWPTTVWMKVDDARPDEERNGHLTVSAYESGEIREELFGLGSTNNPFSTDTSRELALVWHGNPDADASEDAGWESGDQAPSEGAESTHEEEKAHEEKVRAEEKSHEADEHAKDASKEVKKETKGSAKTEEKAADKTEAEAIVVAEGGQQLRATDGSTYHVTVTYGDSAGIPQGAELRVREITKNDMDYVEYLAQSARELGVEATDTSFAKVLDISFVDPVTGNEFEPTGDVHVRIELAGESLVSSEEAGVVHFGDKVEALSCDVSDEQVEFTVDGFSTFVVMGYGTSNPEASESADGDTDPEYTVPTPVEGLVYTGEAQELVTAGTVTVGTMKYSLQEDGEYDTAVPTGTNAGTYTVYYMVEGDETHNDVAVNSVETTIAPAPVTLTAVSTYRNYTGEEQVFSGFTASVEGLTFEGVVASGSGTEKGAYDVTFTGVVPNETTDSTGNYIVTQTTNGTLTIQTLLTKRLASFNGNLATYELVVNPEGYQLNGGQSFTLNDRLMDKKNDSSVVTNNQSINYSSVGIEPADAGVVFDYSGYTGTFVIPDATAVTITYTTRVEGNAGENVWFGNVSRLMAAGGDSLGELANVSAVETETITPTGTDISGTGGVYSIELYTYADGHMETGLAGAEFRLLDANQRPITYKAGENEGKEVTFVTESDGYVTVQLTEEQDGLYIHKNTPYYLEMLKAPVTENGDDTFTYYEKDNTLYGFLVTDDPDYTYKDVYSYFNGDVLKVRCYEESEGIHVTKRFAGNQTISDEQKNGIVFILEKENTATGGWDEVEQHPYSEFTWGSMAFNTGSKGWSAHDYGATYRVREENAEVEGVDLNDTCFVSVEGRGKSTTEESNEFLVNPDEEAYSFSLVFTNEYFNHRLDITVLDEEHGTLLPGAVFEVRAATGEEAAPVATLTTNESGTIEITRTADYQPDTLYYAVETTAPEGYLLPADAEKAYFYFSENNTKVPEGLPAGESALDLTKSYSTMMVANSKQKIHFPVIVAWGLTGIGEWPDSVSNVDVSLTQSVKDGEETPVEGKTVRLTSAKNFDNSVFRDLPARDEDGKDITYTLVETIHDANGNDITKQFAVSQTITGTGWHLLRNQDAVSVTIQKQWFAQDGSPVSGNNKEAVKYDLYCTTEELEGQSGAIAREDLESHLKSAKKIRGELTLSKESEWKDTVYSLQKTDASGNPYYYFALEDEGSMPQNHEDTYTIAPATESANRTLTIRNTQTDITVIVKAKDCEKTYGGEDPVFGFDVTVQDAHTTATWEKVAGEDNKYNVTVTAEDNSTHSFTFTLNREEGENVGTYTLTPAKVTDLHGYRVRFDEGTLTIHRAEAVVTAGAQKVYGDEDPALVTITGLMNGDGETVIRHEEYREPGEDVGEYPITVSGARNQGNYRVTFVQGSLSITPAAATVKANNSSKEYGEEEPEHTVKITGLKAGDAEGVIEYSLLREPGNNVGTYAISVTGDAAQGNYNVTFVNGEFTITHAPAVVKVENAEKTYGVEDPAWVVTIDGLKGNDPESLIVYNVSRAAGNNVGDYTITATGEAEQGNYSVTYETGTLSIQPAELTVTPDEKFRSINDSADPVLTATVTGWQYNDDEAVHSVVEGKEVYTLNGTTILTFALSREAGNDPGDYVISAAGESAQGNYVLNYETGTFTILAVHNVDVFQETSDLVDPSANPAYSYVAQLDLSGTGLSSAAGFDENNQCAFGLPGEGSNHNQFNMQIPYGAKLTVTQTSANSDYLTTLAVDGASYDDGGSASCVIDEVNDYYAITFTHTRISLPVQAMAGIDQTEEGAATVGHVCHLGIPGGDAHEQLFNNDTEPYLQETLGYTLPTDKYYEFDHASLFAENGTSIATGVTAVTYDQASGNWKYKTDGDYADLPDGAVVRMYYYPKYICKVGEEKFYTLNAALDYVQETAASQGGEEPAEAQSKTATIEMLLGEYRMPATDRLTIPAGYDITITTATEGYTGASTPAVIKRRNGFSGNLFVNNGKLTFKTITLDGNGESVTGADALVLNNEHSELLVDGDAIVRNTNGVNGSALYMAGGTATINGALQGYYATHGGAVYVAGGMLNIAGSVSTTNGAVTATSGGAVFMTGGTVNVQAGATMNGNTAVNGGVFYVEGGTVNIGAGTLNNNKATNAGGMLYATGGDVNITGGTIKTNQAVNGDGGAIFYNAPGALKVSGGTLQGNKATNGNGGFIYQSSGEATLSSTINETNTAKNGAAIYVHAGIANFNGVNITGNKATEGGAVGVDETARLYFYGNAKVTGNTNSSLSTSKKDCNVYLDEDSDEIINVPTAEMGGSANIGVYVADSVRATRGEVCCSFGAYVSTKNLAKFKDDRGFYNVYNAGNKLYWGKPIKYTVLYKQSGLLPTSSGTTQLQAAKEYYPRKTENAIYDLVTTLYNEQYKDKIQSGYVYAYSYVKNATAFEKYITNIDWDATSRKWVFKQHDGTSTNATNEFTIYYSDAAYISVVNNSGYDLTINPLTVMGKDVVSDGYGYTIAVNNVTKSTLVPITSDELTIPHEGSVKLLFPGATSSSWSTDGVFAGATAANAISYTLDSAHGGQPQQLATTDVEGGAGFNNLSGTLLSDAGVVYEILFGDPTPICKVGNVPFTKLTDAMSYITTNGMTTATIEMLVDYQQPADDILEIPEGYNITLTTAERKSASNPLGYVGEDSTRAAISRSSGDMGSAVKALIRDDNTTVLTTDEQCTTSITLSNIIFDGKALGQGGQGGAISTVNTKVSVDGCEFKGYTAARGGAVYTRWGQLEVKNSNFTKCLTLSTADKTGGGGIWTTAHSLLVENCVFNECSCPNVSNGRAQAGAVFHNIRNDGAVVYPNDPQKFPKGFSKGSQTDIIDCKFYDCYAANGSGGTVESDAWVINIEGCEFYRSETRKAGGNGGAVNIYSNDNTSISKDSILTVEDCYFEDCSAPNGNTNGGCVRTNTYAAVVRNSVFRNARSNNTGGALSMTYGTAGRLEIDGCAFENCSSGTKCGAVYAQALVLTIKDSFFTNCTSPSYGAVYQDKDSTVASVTVSNSSFENCSATNSGGGALYATARNLSISGMFGGKSYTTSSGEYGYACGDESFTFDNCTATREGGAVYHTTAGTETLSDVVFTSCLSGVSGGGAYLGNSKLAASNAVFNNCKAANSGGGLYISPSTNGATFSDDCSFSGNWVTASDGKGGSLYINQGTVTINGGSFADSKAAYGGGIYQKGTLTLNDTSIAGCYAAMAGGGLYHEGTTTASGSIADCYAARGGGVYSSGALTMGSAPGAMSISGCYAKGVTISEDGTATVAASFTPDNLGGGVYNNAGNVSSAATIENCNAYDGGGIYQANATFTTSGGSIEGNDATHFGGGVYYAGGTFKMSSGVSDVLVTGNTANKGAGVFVADGKTMDANVWGGYHCEISGNHARSEGGGIAVGGPNAILKFKDYIIVKDNTQVDEDTACNIYLDQNSNTVIQTSGTLDTKSYIGVYASNAQEAAHGVPAMPFGTRANDNNLNRFFNDRIPYLYGYKGANKLIVWSDFVCRITDGEGNLLYKDAECTMPAVYPVLENDGTESAFGALAAANYKLYNHEREYGKQSGDAYQVQMLVQDYAATKPMKLETGKTVTLTTATEKDECGFQYNGDPKHPYATITRAANDFSMISNTGGNLTLAKVVVDGGSEAGRSTNTNGGLIMITSGGTVTLDDGSTLRNSLRSGNTGSGAIRMESGTNNMLVMKDGALITNCSGSEYGGAISVKQGTFSMEGGSITNCSSKSGGAARIDTNMYMSGGVISGNNATVDGGGISIGGTGSRLYFSGNAVVQDNTLNGSTTCNVQLSQYTHGVINTYGDGLGAEAKIGVYTAGTESNTSSLYYKHGMATKPFGTWASDANLYCFVNDRNGLTGGKKDLTSATDKTIYWVGKPVLAIMKVVESDWSADKNTAFSFTVTLDMEMPAGGMAAYGFVAGEDGKPTRTFTQKDGEDAYQIDLPEKLRGTPYTVTENLTSDQESDFNTQIHKVASDLEESIGGRSIAGILGEHGTTTSDLTFTNTRVTGELSVSKTMQSKDEADFNKAFDFTVTLDDATITKVYPTVVTRVNEGGEKTETDEEISFVEGVANLQLKHDESVTIKDLPTDVPYTVSEVVPETDQDAYRTRVSKDGATSHAGTSQAGTVGEVVKEGVYTSSVDFINNRLEIVCKITNANRELLYYKDNGELTPAIYFRLEDAFVQINNGGLRTSSDGSASGALHIEMVVTDYTMEEPAILNKGKTVTLTTARTTDERYPYNYGKDDENGNTSVVLRGYNGDSMIVDSGTLTVDNITLDGNAENNYVSTGSGGIIKTNGNVRLTVSAAATLRDSTVSEENGGAIWMDENAQLTMNGTIDNCKAYAGGGIYATPNFRSVTVGGTISNSEATTGNGGAVCAGTGGTVTINNNAMLEANKAHTYGGAIYAESAVTVKGTIRNNTAHDGGGVYVGEGAAFTMSAGSVAGNEALGGNGGGIWVDGTTRITGGSFAENKALDVLDSGNGKGGAIYTTTSAVVSISGANTTFAGNQAKQGGAIYDQCLVTMAGGSMTANTATETGGAVYVDAEHLFTMSGGNISGNSSPEGAISTGEHVVLTFSGNSVVSGNTSSDDATVPMNVYLGYDTNAIITTSGLGRNANIGVYAADGENEDIYYEHGIAARNFGTYTGTGPGSANLNKFVNDRDTTLRGMAGAKQGTEEDGSYLVMWPGKDVYLQISQFDVQMGEDGKPIMTDDDKYIPVTSPLAVKDAQFILTNTNGNEDAADDVVVWTGASDAAGHITIPWTTEESENAMGASFAPGSTYELKQQVAGKTYVFSAGAWIQTCVLPAGSWTLAVARNNAIAWQTVSPESEQVNRTLDVQAPSDEAGLGDTFTVFNDRMPRITFDANGGKLYGNRKSGEEETKTEVVEFENTDVSADYSIEEKNPTWNTLFLNWNTEQEPDDEHSGTEYNKDDKITFYRRTDYDDLTLYAQWIPVVCKITNRENELLYVDGSPAIYSTLQDGFEDFNTKKFTLANGKSATPRKIKMLVSSYNLTVPLTLERGKTAILTTASKDDKDGYPYRPTNDEMVCTIKRAFEYPEDGTKSMITNKFNLTFTDITLDGAKDTYKQELEDGTIRNTVRVDGGIVNVTGDYAQLTVTTGATLRNSAVGDDEEPHNGGAIYAHENTTVTIAGGAVVGNEANGYNETTEAIAKGGALFASTESEVYITGGVINGNSAVLGAGVYLPVDSTLHLSGKPSFGGTDLKGGDGEDKDDLKGEEGNFVAGPELEDAKNGGKDYVRPRQDIYLEGTGDPLGSIAISGGLNIDPGSIWVWAEDADEENDINHYQTLRQFAVFETEATRTRMSSELLNKTLLAFRNARPDDVSANETSTFLSGDLDIQDGDHPTYVYWTGVKGSRKVILRKFDKNTGESLAGGKFKIHRGSADGSVFTGTDIAGNDSAEEFESGESGVFYVGTLSYGTYYVEETQAPSGYGKPADGERFVVTVSEDGVGYQYEEAGETLYNREVEAK
ncbi:MAG: hypothetical protein IKG21_05395 [Atopobiaceae bacterium]|nr:hypothetical protein [Atopobiaceae bacterium]